MLLFVFNQETWKINNALKMENETPKFIHLE